MVLPDKIPLPIFFLLAPQCHLNCKTSSLGMKISNLPISRARNDYRSTHVAFRARGARKPSGQRGISTDAGTNAAPRKVAGPTVLRWQRSCAISRTPLSRKATSQFAENDLLTFRGLAARKDPVPTTFCGIVLVPHRLKCHASHQVSMPPEHGK